MGRDNNTFEKMQRERLKKQKADDKRARRQKRKEVADDLAAGVGDDSESTPEGDSAAAQESSQAVE